jgi:hypothetical protein
LRPARLVALLVTLTALSITFPSGAQASPLRWGRIVTGLGGADRAIGVEPTYGDCQAVADCRAWMESGCDPVLATRAPAPAVTASIVDVANLADGHTPRVIELSPSGDLGLRWGQVVVQFWRGCSEVYEARMLTGYEDAQRRPRRAWAVPLGANWMTITSNVDNINVGWTLR